MVLSQVKLNRVTGWYAGLVRQVFLPNADLFGYLVAFGAARRGYGSGDELCLPFRWHERRQPADGTRVCVQS